jgi:hypothetical protein
MGMSGQASATAYGLSSLSVENLTINITPLASATVNSFSFTLTNTATLNLNSAIDVDACSGFPSNCGAPPVVADALAVNAPGSTLLRANNAGAPGELTIFGNQPSPANWSNSDSVIINAELVSGVPTDSRQIAESNINEATQASANAEIQSTTGFTFSFDVVGGPATLELDFLADPEVRALLLGERPGSSAQANMTAVFQLTQNTGGAGFARWTPRGTLANDCLALGVVCAEDADSQDLNVTLATSVDDDVTHSFDPNALNVTPFGVTVGGITAGTWTMSLTAVTSTSLRTVPEPAPLALLGISLLAMLATMRRRKSS